MPEYVARPPPEDGVDGLGAVGGEGFDVGAGCTGAVSVDFPPPGEVAGVDRPSSILM